MDMFNRPAAPEDVSAIAQQIASLLAEKRRGGRGVEDRRMVFFSTDAIDDQCRDSSVEKQTPQCVRASWSVLASTKVRC